MVSYLNKPMLSLQDILDSAGRLVEKHILDDRCQLDISDLLKIYSDAHPTLSGFYDHDYPSLSQIGAGLDSLAEISVLKKVPLPPELVEQFGRVQCNRKMGLFPQIERAWLTIDRDLFVFSYEDSSDIASFGFEENILTAAVVKPKKDIFQPHIQFLMCLATRSQIVLLGVSFHKSANAGANRDSLTGKMHILPEPVFSIPTDGVSITRIMGADNGRVFMAGKDGCLYELIYQAEDRWFSPKCKIVNHSTSTLSFLIPSFFISEGDPVDQISIDDTRGILYARTQNGTIQVYDLGEDKKGMRRIASRSQASILHSTRDCASLPALQPISYFNSIVNISAVTQRESEVVHLVAVTDTGVRLYFTTVHFRQPGTRPSTLSLLHVRLPPGFSPSTTPQKPSRVHTAYHSQGTLLLVSNQNEDNDLMWAISADSFPFSRQMMELHTTVPIDGKIWALDEIKYQSVLDPLPELAISAHTRSDSPAVVTQHVLPPRKFVVLGAQGIHIIKKLRPLEQLRQLLIDCGSPDAEQVKAFFRLLKLDQACATCIALACSRSSTDQQISDWASMAFYINGGEAGYNYTDLKAPPLSNISFSADLPQMHMSTPAGPQFTSPGEMGNVLNPTQELVYSGKHKGIYIYLSRILSPFWDSLVCTKFTCSTKEGTVTYLTSSFTDDHLCMSLHYIRDLSDFVDFHSKFDLDSQTDIISQGMQDDGIDEHTRKRLQAEAQTQEKISLQHVQYLIYRVEEVIGLWRLLSDHQFHVLAAAMSQDMQIQLADMVFKTLVISGKDVCKTLLKCLINRYLDDSATIDSISSRLRQSNELLQAAKVSQNQLERRQQLREAQNLLKGVCQPLNLDIICSQLAQVHYYVGIVELGLNEARKVDPQQLAVHFYRNGEPQEDVQGMQAYLARTECYNCVIDTLSYLWLASDSYTQASDVPQSQASRIYVQQASLYREEIIQAALRSDDPLFHAALYDWLFTQNNSHKLLEINSPFVEPYLRRKVSMQTNSTKALDILTKYYEKTEQFQAATRIQFEHAERQRVNINLTQRPEYLSRQVICAESSTSGLGTSAAGEVFPQLEENMEITAFPPNVKKRTSEEINFQKENYSTKRIKVDSALDSSRRMQSYSLELDNHNRPPYTYLQLISQAIIAAPEQQAAVANIIDFISQKYKFYRHADQSWKLSIHTTLAVKKQFLKVPRPLDKPGIGCFWALNPEYKASVIFQAYRSCENCGPCSSTSIVERPSVIETDCADNMRDVVVAINSDKDSDCADNMRDVVVAINSDKDSDCADNMRDVVVAINSDKDSDCADNMRDVVVAINSDKDSDCADNMRDVVVAINSDKDSDCADNIRDVMVAMNSDKDSEGN